MSLEAFKIYYVMHASAPSLHRESTDSLIVCIFVTSLLGNIVDIIIHLKLWYMHAVVCYILAPFTILATIHPCRSTSSLSVTDGLISSESLMVR